MATSARQLEDIDSDISYQALKSLLEVRLPGLHA